jgi:hypothetical protein
MFSQAEKKSYWNGYHKGKAEGINIAKPKPRGTTKAKRPHLTISDDIVNDANITPYHTTLGIAGVLRSMSPFNMLPVGPSLHPIRDWARDWTPEEIKILKETKRWKADYYCDINDKSDNYVDSVLLTGGKW